MDAQRTPDTLSTQAENELICERLLAWKRCPSCGEQKWYSNYDRRDATSGPFLTCVTPSFITWAEAGLILEALQAKLVCGNFNTASWDQLRKMGHMLSIGKLSPADVRTSALAFIKAWHGE